MWWRPFVMRLLGIAADQLADNLDVFSLVDHANERSLTGLGIGRSLATAPSAVEATTNPTRRRVLVVDDNHDGAETLSMLLELAGYEIRVAYDGLAALDAVAEFHPDAILLDIGLPLLNGYDVCRRIRDEPANAGVLIVAVTGWGQESDRQRSRSVGFDEHLVKPVDPTELLQLLAERSSS